jgi:predicted nucleotidyltransferase
MAGDIQIIRDLKIKLCVEFGSEIQQVILFGSRSSAKANEFSDYDVLLIMKNKPDFQQKRKISEICYDVELQNDIIIDLHILSELELSSLRGKQPIFQKAIYKGIHV